MSRPLSSLPSVHLMQSPRHQHLPGDAHRCGAGCICEHLPGAMLNRGRLPGEKRAIHRRSEECGRSRNRGHQGHIERYRVHRDPSPAIAIPLHRNSDLAPRPPVVSQRSRSTLAPQHIPKVGSASGRTRFTGLRLPRFGARSWLFNARPSWVHHRKHVG